MTAPSLLWNRYPRARMVKIRAIPSNSRIVAKVNRPSHVVYVLKAYIISRRSPDISRHSPRTTHTPSFSFISVSYTHLDVYKRQAIRRAEELAMAMTARCYHGGEGRTRLNVLAFKRREIGRAHV